MKKTKVTISDVAARAGVSATTVSMILNGNNKFPEQTCRKVIDACNELGYSRGGMFRSAGGNMEEKALVAVVPILSNFCFVQAVEAMQQRAKELGYSLVVFETMRERTQEARIIQICKNFPFAGVIFYYPPENNIYMDQLESIKPVIHIYDKGLYNSENILAVDGLRVGSVIGHHLYSLGHRRVAYLSLDFEKKQVMRERRLEGIRSAFREQGENPDACVMLCTPQIRLKKPKEGLDGYELGYALMQDLIQKEEPVTGIGCLNDMIAIGALDAIADAGKKVPDDYSVCGCDNTLVSKYRGIALTTVEVYNTQAGRFAVEFLTRKIENNDFFSESTDGENPESITQIEYFPKLIVRKTTGTVPKNKDN